MPPPWPEVLAPLAGAIEGALAIGARAVGRLSSQANGIRFGTVQKQEEALRAELRAVRREAGEPGAVPDAFVARLRALLEQVERFAGPWIASTPSSAPAGVTSMQPDSPSAAAAAPGPLTVQQAGVVRQGVTRAMVALANAPLHLRLEFGPGFVDPHPDVPLLAARMHAIHRGVRGSLKQVCWQSVDRAELAFGGGESAQTVEAVFDAEGRLRVPDAVRQNPGRAPGPATPSAGPSGAGAQAVPGRDGRGRNRGRGTQARGAQEARPQPGGSTGRPPVPGGGRAHDAPAGPSPDRGGRPRGPGRPAPAGPARGGPAQAGQVQGGQAQGGQAQGGQPHRGQPQGRLPHGGPAHGAPGQGRPRQGRPGPGRPDGRGGPPAADVQARPTSPHGARHGGRGPDPSTRTPSGGAPPFREDRRPPKPRGPVNPLMADKLRAVLGAPPAPKPATPGGDAPVPDVAPVPPERGSE